MTYGIKTKVKIKYEPWAKLQAEREKKKIEVATNFSCEIELIENIYHITPKE